MADLIFMLYPRCKAAIALQPIVHLDPNKWGETIFLEALLRIPKSSDPAAHVHVLALGEQLGFSHLLDLFVLSRVEDLLRWNPGITIAMNVSQRSIIDGGQMIIERLAESPFCDRIVLEITESSQISRSMVMAFTGAARALGCSVAVDDYGTGSATDELVLETRPQLLKFVMDDLSDQSRDRLARAVALAKRVGAKLVAEKIDSFEKLQLVAENRVDYVQGYLISKPISVQDLPAWEAQSKHGQIPFDHAGTAPVTDLPVTQRIQAVDGGRNVRFVEKTGS